jgi:hypothetical protein
MYGDDQVLVLDSQSDTSCRLVTDYIEEGLKLKLSAVRKDVPNVISYAENIQALNNRAAEGPLTYYHYYKMFSDQFTGFDLPMCICVMERED